MKRKMNKRSRKALSPVVASIILIAVTVAVSIAVAAWMGALTFSFTATEQLNITNMNFQVGDATQGSIQIIANNTGTSAVTINEAWVNNLKQTTIVTVPAGGLPAGIAANTGLVVNMTLSITQGYSYQVKLISSKGNTFLYTATAPS
jgi:flagellin-like protein